MMSRADTILPFDVIELRTKRCDLKQASRPIEVGGRAACAISFYTNRTLIAVDRRTSGV